VQRYRPDAVDPDAIEWDLLSLYKPTSRNPALLGKYNGLPSALREGRVDRTVILHDKLDEQLRQADVWLRKHFTEYAQPSSWPVMLDRAILIAKLTEEYGPLLQQPTNCPDSVYQEHFETTVKATGFAPTIRADEKWAQDKNYSRDSARVCRKNRKEKLSAEEQKKLFRTGR
jgi:hypothetical protein